MIQWRLKKGLDRRFRSGHPWVFSNELQESAKGLAPGALVELTDAGGKFLARGYGNPSSLIVFRCLSRDPEELDVGTSPFFLRKLKEAHALRVQFGRDLVSHRLCFGEGDFIPGLIVDLYKRPEKADVVILQAQTAGIDCMLAELKEALKALYPGASFIIRKDSSARKLEGLEIEAPVIESKDQLGIEEILVPSEISGTIPLRVDLIRGQKTAFYLDQTYNVGLLLNLLKRSPQRNWRVLDLFSYVGHWSVQLAVASKKFGAQAQLTLMDASAPALELAQANLRGLGLEPEIIRADILEEIRTLKDRSYDGVVCDPPALIKGRKNIPAGKNAYMQLNMDALRMLKADGWLVSCSCSGVLSETEFSEILAKAARRSGRQVQWIARGGQPPDHPILAQFPEGQYLKCWIGRVVG